MADLGCSSGPNTLLLISEIIEAIDEKCIQLNHNTPPEFQIFLNDLPSNDYNTIFSSLPAFYEQLTKEKGENFGPCFITGAPGSFYGRLFPSNSIDFFHSTNSLNWLSQVPSIVESNRGNIYLARTTPPSVLKAYLEQYKKDFSLFISLRSKEITPGGRMVLTILGRRNEDPFGKASYFLDLLSMSLNHLVSKVCLVLRLLIEEEKVDSFNMPYYIPSRKELEGIISAEASFSVDRLEIFDANWDASNDDDEIKESFISGQKMAKYVRSVLESMLAEHFGDAIIDVLFNNYTEDISNHLSKEEGFEHESNCVAAVIGLKSDDVFVSGTLEHLGHVVEVHPHGQVPVATVVVEALKSQEESY
ncbi:probable jasmonic acid carboxyl methyltransferase 1 [Telopea speciosissima]|uniref:probable jasmonic acid carboxyl methyltransferase 1 n=1 Tax=Telopea speciosissima TaxID=54955 RepID=UPI001CC4277E|nr:probable jasmonic acid carboxyl methyltransferase 1 [Telopea speciosissima]